MHYTKNLVLVFLAVLFKESFSACVDNFALSSVDALVHRKRNEKAILFRNENFNLLDEYLYIDVVGSNVSQLCEGMIKNFPRLESLSIINANLTLIEPGTFQNVPRLKHLSLSVNQLVTIPREVFNKIPSLKVLYLTRNQIETIDDGAFSQMPELKALHLDHNRITHLTGNILFGSPKISLIDLNYNLINAISKSSFDDLRPGNTVRLLNIYLKNNTIGDIDPEALKPLIPVDLHLENNLLTRISDAVFSVKEGSKIDFANNRVTCVADDVLEWIKVKNIVVNAKNNPVDCGCMERIDNTLIEGEIRGELNINSTLPCHVDFPFFGNMIE